MRFVFIASLLVTSACATPVVVIDERVAQSRPPEPRELDAKAADVAPLVERANAAIGALAQELGRRLVEAMSSGTVGAAEVCAAEAQVISARVSTEQGLALGRTSDRLRNPKNAPRDWLGPWLARNAGKQAEEAKPAVYDLGDRVGVVRPIATQPLCTVCHGRAIEPELEAHLDALYPDDRARGFEIGELRGAFWVEVPRSTR